jgi:hypothetical protein
MFAPGLQEDITETQNENGGSPCPKRALWIENSHRLVSWWDMEKFSAAEFYEITSLLSRIQGIASRMQADSVMPSSDPEGAPFESQRLIKYHCETIGLTVSAKCAAFMLARLANQDVTVGEWTNLLRQLDHTILWEMQDRSFFYMPPKDSSFYDQKELFGETVNRKFPKMQFDIVEAGNCFATGRGTACVFHLMRIMEVGVQELGTALGIVLVSEKNWQVILDEVNKAIKRLPPKDSKTVALAQASANLYSVKLACRNEVMHPKDTYTLEEAENLIRQVKLFMNHLAGII